MNVDNISKKVDAISDISKSISKFVFVQSCLTAIGGLLLSYLLYIILSFYFSGYIYIYIFLFLITIILLSPALLQFFFYYSLKSLIELPYTFREMLHNGEITVKEEAQLTEFKEKKGLFSSFRKLFELKKGLFELKNILKSSFLFIRLMNPWIWILFILSIPLGYIFWFINIILFIFVSVLR